MRELSRGIRLLQLEDYRRMPWKNGLGISHEIAVFPADAGLNGKSFDWRVSLAEVQTDCEFSLFPGYDRTIMLTEGGGVELSFDLAPPLRIEQHYEPFKFKGEWQTRCRLLDGPVRDFNVITARTLRLLYSFEIVRQSPYEIVWQPHSETVICYCLVGGLFLDGVKSGQVELDTQNTLFLEKRSGNFKNVSLKISAMAVGTVTAVVKIRDL